MSADDLVPIFIYVLCQSGLRHPTLNRDLLWAICHPDMLRGECGYYLTIYESAVQYLLSAELDDSIKAAYVKGIANGDASEQGDYTVILDDSSRQSERITSASSVVSRTVSAVRQLSPKNFGCFRSG